MFPYIMQGDNIVIVIDNEPHNISTSHVGYEKIREAIRVQDWDLVRELVNPAEVIINYTQGNVRIENNRLYWGEREFHNALSDRMITMLREGFDVEPLVRFMENVMQNPSRRSVEELYGFLERNNLPLTPDGCFLAYKKVRGDYRDCHTGTIDNSVGQTVTMVRNEVDDNCGQTCSTGLHFCSQEYLAHFSGERTMILKINPRDVVSIPTDYNFSKGRCCAYEVVGELASSVQDLERRVVNTEWPGTESRDYPDLEDVFEDTLDDDLDSIY